MQIDARAEALDRHDGAGVRSLAARHGVITRASARESFETTTMIFCSAVTWPTRRRVHDGHSRRPLQENATTSLWPQVSQYTRTAPYAKMPQALVLVEFLDDNCG
jgi:hypothetical protein